VIERLRRALEGRYTIERELGEGGMATVHLAHDVRHDRKVAVKVLRPELAAVVGAERFLGEIRTTANLQHPHILPLYDSGEADTFLFYVMPHVEGESLKDRIEREKQLPVAEAVRITKAVAAALDFAHRKGVVHRDVKPANILLQDGEPLVADFGIALAVQQAGGNRLTETGLSLGTPHYMSPEQAAADRDPDARSDLYSLACVAYEMLAGEPPHLGKSTQAVLAKILTEPVRPVRELRPTVPPHVDQALVRALEKLPADRFDSVADFALAVDGRFAPADEVTRAVAPVAGGVARRRGVRWAVAVPGLALLGLGAAIGRGLARTAEAPPPLIRLSIEEDSLHSIAGGCCGPSVAISSDGTMIVYEGRVGSSSRTLYVRRLDEFSARPVPGTEGANTPFFSPDGRWLGFVSGSVLRRVSLGGGAPLKVAELTTNRVRGAVLTEDDRIVFAPDDRSTPRGGAGQEAGPVQRGSLFVVSVEGDDAPRPVSRPDTAGGEAAHVLPQILPGGRTALVTSWPASSRNADAWIVGIDLEGDRPPRRITQGMQPFWVETGHLVYALADGSVMARPFDPSELEFTGEAVRITEGVVVHNNGDSEYGVSRSGSLVSRHGQEALDQSLLRVGPRGDRDVLVERGQLGHPRFSPDGTQVVFGRLREGFGDLGDVWIYDIPSGLESRLSTEDGLNMAPLWSRDGRQVRYLSMEGGFEGRVLSRRADELGGQATVFLDVEGMEFLGIPSRGGGPIPFLRVTDRVVDLWLVEEDGTGARPLIESPFAEGAPAVSPGGGWLAFSSNQSGSREVYVQRFPEAQGTVRVSRDGGGGHPVWVSDTELVYATGRGTTASSGDLVLATLEVVDGRVRAVSHVVLPVSELPLETGDRVASYHAHPLDRSLVVTSNASRSSRISFRVELNRLRHLAGGR